MKIKKGRWFYARIVNDISALYCRNLYINGTPNRIGGIPKADLEHRCTLKDGKVIVAVEHGDSMDFTFVRVSLPLHSCQAYMKSSGEVPYRTGEIITERLNVVYRP